MMDVAWLHILHFYLMRYKMLNSIRRNSSFDRQTLKNESQEKNLEF